MTCVCVCEMFLFGFDSEVHVFKVFQHNKVPVHELLFSKADIQTEVDIFVKTLGQENGRKLPCSVLFVIDFICQNMNILARFLFYLGL